MEVAMSSAAAAQKPQHLVQITVNNKKIEIEGPKATGLQIKEAAIAQGVQIELSFQLSEKLGPHKTMVIGDTDTVAVHENQVFVAVADDDNS
jgi:hypothetical protein